MPAQMCIRDRTYIQQMVGAITEQGEKMAKRADLSEFHRYREMIRKLLDEIVSNSYAFRKYRKFDTRGRNKDVYKRQFQGRSTQRWSEWG